MFNTKATELHRVALAADAKVISVAILKPNGKTEPDWTVVTRGDGLRLRVTSSTGAPTQAAINAILAADLTPAGVKARADARNPARAVFRDLVAVAIEQNNALIALTGNVGTPVILQHLQRFAVQNNAIMRRLYQLSEVTDSEI